MKRSEINKIMAEAIEFMKKKNYFLPTFAFWAESEMKIKSKDKEYAKIFANNLGWDITDFGSGDFNKTGLFLFTVRNGNLSDKNNVKPYCEKIIISKVGQITPYHYHKYKVEDIINRGGGVLAIQVYNAERNAEFADTDVKICSDGREYYVPAGSIIRLRTGESVTNLQGMYHQFWAENEPCLIGEVSKVNDDKADNYFYEKIGRFPAIEEDEPPLHLLVSDYDKLKNLI